MALRGMWCRPMHQTISSVRWTLGRHTLTCVPVNMGEGGGGRVATYLSPNVEQVKQVDDLLVDNLKLFRIRFHAHPEAHNKRFNGVKESTDRYQLLHGYTPRSSTLPQVTGALSMPH